MKPGIICNHTMVLVAVLFLLPACTQALPPPTSIPAVTSIPLTPTPNLPFPGLTEWDLLVISDSSNAGTGAPYARLIETDQGVKVSLHNCWLGGLPVYEILERLQGMVISISGSDDPYCRRPWPELVAEAEVMILAGNPIRSPPPDGAWQAPEANSCVGGGYEGLGNDPAALAAYRAALPGTCAPETWITYKSHLRSILDEIDKIRQRKPLILRMTDVFIPVHASWKKEGVDDVCTTCLENYAAAIREVAEEYGVTVVSTLDGLNGPDHLYDPTEKGYIGPDGMHLSDAGDQAVARLLMGSGYGVYTGKK